MSNIPKHTDDDMLAMIKASMFDGSRMGVCTACGYEQDDCDPDTRKAICEDCGQAAVMGAEETLF